MNTFFTADQHFGHANIIKYCNRPFANVYEMNDYLIKIWNETVTKNDRVYHLGDFALTNNEYLVREYIEQLNFKEIFWILGNHDPKKAIRAYRDYGEVVEQKHIKLDGYPPITLNHFPMLSWPKSSYGAWQLFGHHHGTLTGHQQDPDLKIRQDQQIDVGVDTNEYRPYSIEEIKQKLAV